jgi:iron complex transport system substrate-binding protein
MRLFLILTLCFPLTSCNKNKGTTQVKIAAANKLSLKYADGFSVTYEGNLKWVEIKHPYQNATNSFRYVLVPRGQTAPATGGDVKVISIPIEKIVCTSTSHIPLLDYLDKSDALIGFPGTDLVSSEKIRARIDQGKVKDVGIDKGMNLELLAALKPDLLMGYTTSGDYGQFKKLEALGIPVVMNAEYLEKHPLGRAEWIKFMALFFNEEAKADSVFNIIEKNYLDAMALTRNVPDRPSVVSGIVYGDAWFLPGGQNYASRILKDAGCNYLWSDDNSFGYLELSFESVYNKAHDADLWIGVGTIQSLHELDHTDHRYHKFKAYQTKHVYNYDARRGAKGGSEYLELGYLRPDIILKDLIKIAHPELLPKYELYFHKKLE